MTNAFSKQNRTPSSTKAFSSCAAESRNSVIIPDTVIAVSSFLSVILLYAVRIIKAVIISALRLLGIIAAEGFTNKHTGMKFYMPATTSFAM